MSLPLFAQRWRDRRDSYRPAGEVIDPRQFDVAEIAESPAKAFVLRHHYSGSYPAARFRFGLYRGGQLVGVAVFSHPVNDRALTSVFPCRAVDAVELGRFVLLDEVRANGETWFLGRAFEQLRHAGLCGVVSFSDPVPRLDGSGRQVFPGHVGVIYQAHNGAYLGRGTARTLRLLPDATVFSARAAQKIRARERGWECSVARLVACGAPAPTAGECLRAWLRGALAKVTRAMRHAGNHKYAWALRRQGRKWLRPCGPYPKKSRCADGE